MVNTHLKKMFVPNHVITLVVNVILSAYTY